MKITENLNSNMMLPLLREELFPHHKGVKGLKSPDCLIPNGK